MTETTDDDLLAAEVALGVLSGADRDAAVLRLEREPAFARMVATWEETLSPWAGEIAAVVPPPTVWERIAAALPAVPDSKTALRPSLWQSLAFWRGMTVATGALAAACLGLLIYLGSYLGTVTVPAPLMASIDGGGQRHFVATLDTGRGTVAIMPASFNADPARVPELWLIPTDGKPRPLGLLRADQTVTIKVPRELMALVKDNATLAVSLEPQGGSPTGAPTGPVIGSGKLTLL